MKRNITAFARRTQVVLLLLLICIGFNTIRAQTVLGWDFSTLSNSLNGFGPSPYLPTTVNTYINTGTGLVRGSGIGISGTSADRAWGGNDWVSTTKENAITANDYVTFTLEVKSGYTVSVDSISPFDYRRSRTGPDTGVIQYSINGSSYVDITGVKYDTLLIGSNAGNRLPTINTSSISALQNVSSASIITFRIVNWRGTNTGGTWYIYDKPSTSGAANDFVINGAIAEILSNYYRSVASGNWSTVSIWESGPTINGPWLPALAVPTASASGVEIRNAVTLTANQIINGTLRLTSGTLNVNGNTLTLNGNTISGSATVTGSPTSNLIIGGVDTLSFTTGGTNNYFKDVNILSTGRLVLGNTFNITAGSSFGTLLISTGGVLRSNGNLVLKSDAGGTARISTPGGVISTIIGEVVIERYIPAKRAWRLMTHGLRIGTQTINAAWQEGATPNPSTVVLNNPNPGYGTQITKNRATDVVNGYDANHQVTPSIYTMDVGIATLASTYVPIRNFRSYFLFVRGNRANQINLGTAAPTSATVLRTRGNVQIGTTPFSAAAPSGTWVGIGNPYVSSVDIAGVLTRSTGIDPTTFAIWDPGLAAFGGYITYLSGVSTPLTTNYPTTASTFIIQSGQAFLLKTTSASQSIQFVEGDKVASSSSSVFARPVRIPVVHIELRDSSALLLDGVAFGNASPARAGKLGNFGTEAMQLTERDSNYAIVLRPLGERDTFFLEFAKLKKQTYHLRFIEELGELDVKAQLIDRFTHRRIPFTKGINGYAFTVTSDSASFRNRFVLVVRKASTTPSITPRMVTMSPNPVLGRTQLRANGAPYSGMVTITDLSGRVIATRLVTHGVLDCIMIPPGTYICTCPGQGSVIFTTRR